MILGGPRFTEVLPNAFYPEGLNLFICTEANGDWLFSLPIEF